MTTHGGRCKIFFRKILGMTQCFMKPNDVLIFRQTRITKHCRKHYRSICLYMYELLLINVIIDFGIIFHK